MVFVVEDDVELLCHTATLRASNYLWLSVPVTPEMRMRGDVVPCSARLRTGVLSGLLNGL
jgi:hypothetical protein